MPTGNPTGIHLPALVHDKKTRVGGEFFLYYNLQRARIFGSVGLDADDNEAWLPEQSCGEVAPVPPSNIGIIRAKVPIKAGVETTWAVAGVGDGVLPAYAPLDQSAEIGTIPGNFNPVPANFTVTGAEPGDAVEVIALPSEAGNVLICYDTGFTANAGEEFRAIPRKFDSADHFVRQRAENTLDLSEFRVSNLDGLSRLKGRRVTLIGKFFPDGGAVPSEIFYFIDALLNVPLEIPDEANDSVNPGITGSFRKVAILTAVPE